jgi:HEAT repeat protein
MMSVFLGVACGGEDAPAPPTGQPEAPEAAAPAAPQPAAPAEVRKPASPVLEKIKGISNIPTEVEDPEEAVKQLRPWLGDADRDIREAAILALWDLETDGANQALAEVVREEGDAELRGYAVEELVEREAPEALDVLLLVLDDTDTDLREQAAEGLETLEDPRAIPGLYKRLDQEKDEWVRDAILSALDTMDPDFDEEKYEQ